MSRMSKYKPRKYEVISKYLDWEHGQRIWRNYQRELASTKEEAKEEANTLERNIKRKLYGRIDAEYKVIIEPYSKFNAHFYRA